MPIKDLPWSIYLTFHLVTLVTKILILTYSTDLFYFYNAVYGYIGDIIKQN